MTREDKIKKHCLDPNITDEELKCEQCGEEADHFDRATLCTECKHNACDNCEERRATVHNDHGGWCDECDPEELGLT